MANKRMELEQYKSFISLVEEEPSRKMVKRGATIALIISILLAFLLLVLGFLSVELARNPKNIIEKPGSKKKSEIDRRVRGEYANIPCFAFEFPLSLGAGEDSLIAFDSRRSASSQPPLFQEPGEVKITPESPKTSPNEESSDKAKTEKPKKKKKSLPLQTKGAGNLSNLARSVNQRGFNLYLIVLTAALAVIGGIAIGRIRKGKYR